MPFNSKIVLGYSIRYVKQNWGGKLKLNFIHQLLYHAEDVCLLVTVFILYRKTHVSAVISNLTGEEVTAERTKRVYVL